MIWSALRGNMQPFLGTPLVVAHQGEHKAPRPYRLRFFMPTTMSTSWHWSPKRVIAFEELGELMGQLEQPIMSQACESRKVHRLSRKGVHSSEWKRPAPVVILGDDIVSSTGGPVAVRKGGDEFATRYEHKRTSFVLQTTAV